MRNLLAQIEWKHWNRWFVFDYKTMMVLTVVLLVFWGIQGLLYSNIEDHVVQFDHVHRTNRCPF